MFFDTSVPNSFKIFFSVSKRGRMSNSPFLFSFGFGTGTQYAHFSKATKKVCTSRAITGDIKVRNTDADTIPPSLEWNAASSDFFISHSMAWRSVFGSSATWRNIDASKLVNAMNECCGSDLSSIKTSHPHNLGRSIFGASLRLLLLSQVVTFS